MKLLILKIAQVIKSSLIRIPTKYSDLENKIDFQN